MSDKSWNRNDVVLGLRFVQLLCIVLVIVGSIWGSSDLLINIVLVDIPIAPMSVLFIVYASFIIILRYAEVRK